MTDDYDLIVLGGGMAGLPIAMKAAYSGLETALVEEGLLGGTCLNRGCIPTKTMIRSAEVANLARRSEEFGADIDGDINIDLDKIMRMGSSRPTEASRRARRASTRLVT